MSTPLLTCVDVGVRAGSKNWAKQRMTGIGASEIAMALGIAPPTWGSPRSLYHRKRGELPDYYDNAAMEWGRELEGVILQRFLKCHPEFRGNPCITGKLYRSIARPWQLATPDGVVFDTRYGFHGDKHTCHYTRLGMPVVVQVKTGTKREGWGQEGTDEIPVYYKAQVLQEMDVVGAEVAWIPVLFNGRDYREYRVRRHEGDINVLRLRGSQFWLQVQKGDPPPADSSVATRSALKALRYNPDDRAQVPDDLHEKYARAKALFRRAEVLKAKYENELRDAMGDAQYAMAGTRLVASRSTYMQGQFDLATFRDDHPDLAEKYTHPVKRERFTITTREKDD